MFLIYDGNVDIVKGELITTDLIGPFPPTPEGHRYAISYTDDFSRHSIVYFLKKKSEAAHTVTPLDKYYKIMGIIIKKIRSDRGGEYGGHNEREHLQGGAGKIQPSDSEHYGTAYDMACKEHEILHEPIPAHMPALNGVAERWNRTIMNMANSMMYNARISSVLWSSAVAHSNYIRNRLPTRSRGNHTPHELFTNRRPRYDNIKIWGCYCYRLIPVRNKLPGLPTRERLIYVGESSDNIGFRCFNPNTYEFTTEYELILDEEEVKSRHSMLDAFDNRRKLIKNNKVFMIPVVSAIDQTAELNNRKVYTNPNTENQSNHKTLPSVNETLSRRALIQVSQGGTVGNSDLINHQSQRPQLVGGRAIDKSLVEPDSVSKHDSVEHVVPHLTTDRINHQLDMDQPIKGQDKDFNHHSLPCTHLGNSSTAKRLALSKATLGSNKRRTTCSNIWVGSDKSKLIIITTLGQHQ